MLEEKYRKIDETVRFLNRRKVTQPKVAIVLGSGLGGLTKEMEISDEIPYGEIPNFPVSTVKGHKGALLFGRLNHTDIMVFNGRFHYYEGYSMDVITYPEQILKNLGIKTIILSNAAGGLNPSFKIGDIMLIRDHINMFGTNPLIGPNDTTLGPRFPNMDEVYSRHLLRLAHRKAVEKQIHLQEGVYVGVPGPCFETPAEFRMFYMMGAAAVGMSTVPEAIMAHHRGIEVFALSVITDLGIIGMNTNASHDEVLATAARAEPRVMQVIREMLPEI